MVLGDYDVDGTCGVSMFYLFLKNFGSYAVIYIPDRITKDMVYLMPVLIKHMRKTLSLSFPLTAELPLLIKSLMRNNRH